MRGGLGPVLRIAYCVLGGSIFPDPKGNLSEGLGKIDPVDADAQNVHRRKIAPIRFPPSASLRLCERFLHRFPAAASNTANVSRAAFSQEKRLTFA